MPLIKTRPDLTLRIQQPVIFGKTVQASLRVSVPKKLPVEAITVTVRGQHVSTMGEHGNSNTFLTLVAELSAEKVLAAGDHEIPFIFTIPEGQPTSYVGNRVSTEYKVHGHVDIDWWPDKRTSWPIVVDGPRKEHMGKPAVFKMAAQTGPSLELSMMSDVVSVGSELVCSVAFVDFDDTAVRSMTASVITHETCGGSQTEDKKTFNVPLSGELTESFRIQVPRVATERGRDQFCTFYTVSHSLEVRTKIGVGKDVILRAPIRVVPKGNALASEDALPEVGNTRRLGILLNVAAATGLHVERGALVSADKSLRVAVAKGQLHATFSYPSLGLSLQCSPRKTLDGILGRGMDVGSDAFMKAYSFSGREEEQVAHLVHAIEPLVASLDILTMTDTEFVCSSSVEAEEEMLTLFCRVLSTVTAGIDNLRRTMPLPSVARESEGAWEAAAKREAGLFRRGALSLHYEFEDIEAEIAPVWDGRFPTATLCTVSSASEIDASFRGEELSGEVKQLVEQIEGEVEMLSIFEFNIIATMPFDANPDNALKQLLRMVRLRKAMQPEIGPYR